MSKSKQIHKKGWLGGWARDQAKAVKQKKRRNSKALLLRCVCERESIERNQTEVKRCLAVLSSLRDAIKKYCFLFLSPKMNTDLSPSPLLLLFHIIYNYLHMHLCLYTCKKCTWVHLSFPYMANYYYFWLGYRT